MSVSVIVPTHNRHRRVERLVRLLQVTPAISEILVVDDGSTPPVSLRSAVDQAGAQTLLIRSEQARGLSAARNAGAKVASGEFLLFLDDDCIVARDAVERLRAACEQDERLAVVGPTLAYSSDPDTIWCGGIFRGRWTGRTYFRGQGRDLRSAVVLIRASDDFPSVFLVRRSCYEEVHGFDEDNFAVHMTEAELGERLRDAGYVCELVPDAVAWHAMDSTEPLARRLHLTSRKTAFAVGCERIRFLKMYPRQHFGALHLAIWLIGLVPVYVTAALCDKKHCLPDRVGVASRFLAGTWRGLTQRPPGSSARRHGQA